MLEIRKVKIEDSEILLQWRNNPEVYRFALNPNKVEFTDHKLWFEKILTDERCIFYMGMSEGTPCGSIRYQLNEDMTEAEVSISLAPEFWGKGMALKLMTMAETALKNESAVKVIHATVLNENASSMKLFSKAEFSPNIVKFKKNI